MRWAIFFTYTFLLFSGPGLSPAAAQVQHEVFLPNTEHELNVYRISGDEPGKTIMIIGGIQGDEPGSYLTADLYADIHLKKGNLIVVPRANLYSILLNRRNGATGDMNRKFDKDKSQATHLEEEIVTILKRLIAESDCLLNLHEGSGYYSPTWISDMENPKRYGQSIIFDTDSYPSREPGKMIELGTLARAVIAKVNEQLPNSRYHFRANNHNTSDKGSLHKEQRKSATFYALTQAHIPAFGVETSKQITDLATKITMQKLVINTFMAELGIILDAPGISVEKPQLNYLLVKINNEHPVALANKATLNISPGDEITVTDILANYPRGVTADIEDVGTRNDTNMPFRISRPTRIIIRKDAEECGWVMIEPVSGTPSAPAAVTAAQTETVVQLKAEALTVNVEDRVSTLTEGGTLKVPRGARIIIQGVSTNIPSKNNSVFVNFKGFAPPKSINDGNDLNFPIYTGQDLLPRFSQDKKGELYPIIVTYEDKTIGQFWVEINGT